MLWNQYLQEAFLRYRQKDPENIRYLVEYHNAVEVIYVYFARSNSGLANSDDLIPLCTSGFQGMPKFPAEMKEAMEAKDRNEERSAGLPGDLPRAKGHVIFHLSCYPRGELLRIIPWERSRSE